MRVQLSLQNNKGSVFILPEEVVKVLDCTYEKEHEDDCCYIKCRGEEWEILVLGNADEVNAKLNIEQSKQEIIRVSKEEHTIPSISPKFIDRGS